MIVFHGGTDIVAHPKSNVGRTNLDFGLGFYVTDIRDQAVEWAKKVSDYRKLPPIITQYELQRESILSDFRSKVFTEYDGEWLDFIVASRLGHKPWEKYDYIEGGVADDRVVDTINLYMADLMSRDKALERLSEHRPNNQMCLLSQQLIEKHLVFYGADEL